VTSREESRCGIDRLARSVIISHTYVGGACPGHRWMLR